MMSAQEHAVESVPSSHEPSWGDFLRFVGRHWRLLAVFALSGLVIGIGAMSLQTRLYAAQAVIVVVEDDISGSFLGELPGGIGALAAASGISFSQGSRKNEYLAVLKSKALLREFIQQRDLVKVLFAERWDATAGKWKTSWLHGAPNLESAVLRFDRKMRGITEDRRSGSIQLQITWRDRVQAAQWANDLVRRANENLRNRAITEAQDSVVLLQRELQDARSVELQQGINKLIEAQIKSGTAARVRPEFAFRFVDPAVAPNPETVAWPRGRVFGSAGLILGTLLGVLAALVRTRLAGERPVDNH